MSAKAKRIIPGLVIALAAFSLLMSDAIGRQSQVASDASDSFFESSDRQGTPDEIFATAFQFFPVLGPVTMRTDSIRKYSHLDYLYAWDEALVRMYGDRPRLVQEGDNPRVAPSNTTFTGGVAGDSFGFRMTGVADWDSDQALAALAEGSFELYVEDRLNASATDGIMIDRHADTGGLKLGFGVDSSTVQTDSGDSVNRTDRVSQPGEALLLRADTAGMLQPDPNLPGNTHYEFVPNWAEFVNAGLDPQTRLVLSDLHLEPVNVNPANISCAVDYFIYDRSEQTLIEGQAGEAGHAIGVLLASLDRIGTLPGTWEVDDGDIIVLAYNKDTVVFREGGGTFKHSWGLWSLRWDLVDRE